MACLIAIAFIAGGCGKGDDTDYAQRFDALMPFEWRLLSQSGGIDRSCEPVKESCGSLERKYEFDADVQAATRSLSDRVAAQGCRGRKEGNGITINCPDLRLVVSFAGKTASVGMSKT